MICKFLFIGTTVGLVVAVITYLIIYEEYQHHLEGKRVFRESIRSALVTFIFFPIY